MKVLVTRPLEDGEETARQLAARGHQALLAPLLTTRFWDGPQIALEGVQAILATSANGVRALARRSQNRDLPIFAVGPQTAAQASALGFQNVKSADGDAAALAEAAKHWAAPGQGALLQIVGEGNDGKLAGLLPGFTVRREILYAVTVVDEMPEVVAMALRQGGLDAALFFSPRSARAFRDCVIRGGLPVTKLLAACISPAAAAALAPLAFARTAIAARPNQEGLLEVID